MNRNGTLRFQPRVEDLEERCTPSTLSLPNLIFADVALVGQQSDTHIVPFKLSGGGPGPVGMPLFPGGTAPHEAAGTATYLGKHTGAGTYELGSLDISPTGAVTGFFQGTFVFVAANGDAMAFTYGDGFTGELTGQLTADGTAVTDVKFDGFFTLDAANSTGRFQKFAGGSFRMIATVDEVSLLSSVPGFTAPFEYAWSGAGSLEVGS